MRNRSIHECSSKRMFTDEIIDVDYLRLRSLFPNIGIGIGIGQTFTAMHIPEFGFSHPLLEQSSPQSVQAAPKVPGVFSLAQQQTPLLWHGFPPASAQLSPLQSLMQ
jgi:hypothetical protein